MTRHLKIFAHCAISFLVTLGCFVLEIIRFGTEITLLIQRWQAMGRGQLTEWESQYIICPYFIPGTDVANQPAGEGTTPAWRLVNCIFLLVIAGGECPNGKWLITHFDTWCIPFSSSAGTWYTGVLQMQIACALLSTATTSMSNYGVAYARYVFALALLAVGFSNLVLGMLFGSEIREWRGQIASGDSDGGGPSNADKVREAFEVLDSVLATMKATTTVGPLYGLRAAFNATLKWI